MDKCLVTRTCRIAQAVTVQNRDGLAVPRGPSERRGGVAKSHFPVHKLALWGNILVLPRGTLRRLQGIAGWTGGAKTGSSLAEQTFY